MHKIEISQIVGSYNQILASSSSDHKSLSIITEIDSSGITHTHYLVKLGDKEIPTDKIIDAFLEYNNYNPSPIDLG